MCPGGNAPFPLRREGRFFHRERALFCRLAQEPGRTSGPAAAGVLARKARIARRRPRGVTLLELLTTLAILTLLCTFGLTGITDLVDRHRIQTVLHLLSTDLVLARNTAITRRSQIVACPGEPQLGCRPDADWSHGWIVFVDPDGKRRPEHARDLLRASGTPSGAPHPIRLTSTRSFVRYQGDGRSAGTNLTIHVCHRDRLAGQVVVNNLGRTRTARPSTETACPL